MKLHVLILTVLLSLIGGRNTLVRNVRDAAEYAVIESTQDRPEDRNTHYQSFGILASRTAGYSGESNSVSPSVRLTSSGRRVQASGKAPFRIIKDGKVIDRYNFYTFQTDLKRFSSGIHSAHRFIYSICRLLI